MSWQHGEAVTQLCYQPHKQRSTQKINNIGLVLFISFFGRHYR